MKRPSKTPIEDKKDQEFSGKIKGMFFHLRTSTEKFLEELDRSYELYKIGEKTEITKKLEELASKNKNGEMETELIGKLLHTLNSLGKKVVMDGFIKNSKDIERAFLLSENDNRILYGVVPKKGKDEQLRKSVTDFYTQTSHWEMFKYTEPLFQVIPANLIEKIKYKSTIL